MYSNVKHNALRMLLAQDVTLKQFKQARLVALVRQLGMQRLTVT